MSRYKNAVADPKVMTVGIPFRVMQSGREFAHKLSKIEATFEAQTSLWNRFVEIEFVFRRDSTRIIDGAMAPGMTRKQAAAQAKEAIAKIETIRREAVNEAANDSGLWWAHKEVIKERYDTARVKAMKDGATLRPESDPQERGALRVRWQNGLPIAQLTGDGNSLAGLRIVGERKRKWHGKLRFCIESVWRDKDYVTLPIVLWRPLPGGATVQHIVLYRRRHAGLERWFGSIVVRISRPPVPKPPQGEPIELHQEDLRDSMIFTREIAAVARIFKALAEDARRFLGADSSIPIKTVDEILHSTGFTTYSALRSRFRNEPGCKAFFAANDKRWQEALRIQGRALRRRKDEYELEALAFARKHRLIELHRSFWSAGPLHPAWGEFTKILTQACEKTGCKLEFKDEIRRKTDSDQGAAAD